MESHFVSANVEAFYITIATLLYIRRPSLEIIFHFFLSYKNNNKVTVKVDIILSTILNIFKAEGALGCLNTPKILFIYLLSC